MTLRLPSFPETLGVQEFPLDLNRMEVHGEPMAHLLGSWAADLPDGSEPAPFFTCFAPNVTLRPECCSTWCFRSARERGGSDRASVEAPRTQPRVRARTSASTTRSTHGCRRRVFSEAFARDGVGAPGR